MLRRGLVSIANARSAAVKTVSLIPGDGVGPELMASVKEVFTSASVPVQFEEVGLTGVNTKEGAYEEAIASISKNGICLMGALENAQAAGLQQSMNFQLRNDLGVFGAVANIKSIEGLQSKFSNVDIVAIRETAEGEYKCLEHEPVPGVVEALKITTEENSDRIHKFAFDFALRNGRKKVTCIHKANIMKKGDGLFLRRFREVAKLYPMIESQDMIVDNTCMQLVSNPHQFDVMVMPNLYGAIIDNLAAGLVGGAGVVPAEAYSTQNCIFESGARHTFGAAAFKNIANPTAVLLASANMLDHMSLGIYGSKIRGAVTKTIKLKKTRTLDMGGYATTEQFTKAVIKNL